MAMLLSPDYQILTQLVKHEIWPGTTIGTEENIVRLLSAYSFEQWKSLFTVAARQGVLAIAWDALNSLYFSGKNVDSASGCSAEEFRELRIRWELSANRIREVQLRQREVLKELAIIFAESGISVMVLKGLGLAELYPRPEHRECGDLDIYLFGIPGSFEKGNELITKMGIEVEYDGGKHAKFYFKGIPVENHKCFLNVTYSQVDKNLENHLHSILEEQKCVLLPLGGISVNVPPPDFQFLFLTRHCISHFLSSGIVLRHLYDFGIFYTTYFAELDLSRLEEILKLENQFLLYRIFLDVLHTYLGMPEPGEQGEQVERGEQVEQGEQGEQGEPDDMGEPGELGELGEQVEWGNLGEQVETCEPGELLAQKKTPVNQNITDRVLEDIISHPCGGGSQKGLENMWVYRRKAIGAVRLIRSRWKYQLVEKQAFRNRFLRAVQNVFL